MPQSEFIEKLFGAGGAPQTHTRETLSRELLTEGDLDTKTEIRHPIAMSILDSVGALLSPQEVRNTILQKVNPKLPLTAKLCDIKPGTFINFFDYRLRINYISNERKSRQEFIEAIKPTEFETDRQSRKMDRLLLHLE
jgi:hypothetical protein